LPQKLASLSIDEKYPSASLAGDSFVLVGRRVLIAVEPMLDFYLCYWAGEQQNEVVTDHRFLMRKTVTPLEVAEHILQQAALGVRDLNRLKSSAFEKLSSAT
jgi:hypothetical protein